MRRPQEATLIPASCLTITEKTWHLVLEDKGAEYPIQICNVFHSYMHYFIKFRRIQEEKRLK